MVLIGSELILSKVNTELKYQFMFGVITNQPDVMFVSLFSIRISNFLVACLLICLCRVSSLKRSFKHVSRSGMSLFLFNPYINACCTAVQNLLI